MSVLCELNDPSSVGTQVSVSCPVCESPGRHVYRRVPSRSGYEGEISVCEICSLVFLSNRPDKCMLAELNERCCTNQFYERASAFRFGLRDRLFNRLFVRAPNKSRVDYIERMYTPLNSDHAVLDFGCGMGGFLNVLRNLRGCAVAGIESASATFQALRAQVEWPVFSSVSDAVRRNAGPFDVITLNHVLEHLDNPVRTLLDLRRLARPNARLIVEVPNVASWPRKWFGDDWLGWQVPFHLSHFSPATLGETLARGGWKPLSFDYPMQVVGLTYSLAERLGLRWLDDMYAHLFPILISYCLLAPLGPVFSVFRANDFLVAVATPAALTNAPTHSATSGDDLSG